VDVRRAVNEGRCLVDPRPLLRYDFGPGHPFKVHRLGLVFDLLEAYGLVNLDSVHLILPREAETDEACRFHTAAYLEVLRLADTGLWTPNLFAHGLGTADNPVFPGVYEWALSVAGASIDCARELMAGDAGRAFNPAGGLHHAMPSRASGFCHVNDAALAIHALVASGRRVAYVDIDAHHGDGVQHAFYDRPEVLTVSVHQTGTTIFPGTGFAHELGGSRAKGAAVNVPLPPGAADDLYERVAAEILDPVIELYAPDVLVTQLGADALRGDRVASLNMSLRQFERTVRRFASVGVPWLALGGGGYDVGNVVRAWTLSWAVMNDVTLPEALPEGWSSRPEALEISALPLRGNGPTGPSPGLAVDDVERTIAGVRETVFPLLEALARG